MRQPVFLFRRGRGTSRTWRRTFEVHACRKWGPCGGPVGPDHGILVRDGCSSARLNSGETRRRWNPEVAMTFPITRLRRLRQHAVLRDMVRETRVRVEQFIYPLFAVEGTGVRREIPSMPGVHQLGGSDGQGMPRSASPSVSRPSSCSASRRRRTTRAPPPGSAGRRPEGHSQPIEGRAPRPHRHRRRLPLRVHGHGHCGVIATARSHNDATLELLAQPGCRHAERGRRHRRAERHDGRPRRRHPQSARRSTVSNTRRSSPTPRSTRSAFLRPVPRSRESRRSSATGAATRWIPPTGARPCGRRDSTRGRRRHGHGQARARLPRLIRGSASACDSPLAATTSPANTRWSRPPRRRLDRREPDRPRILTAIMRAGADLILTSGAKDAAAWL